MYTVTLATLAMMVDVRAVVGQTTYTNGWTRAELDAAKARCFSRSPGSLDAERHAGCAAAHQSYLNNDPIVGDNAWTPGAVGAIYGRYYPPAFRKADVYCIENLGIVRNRNLAINAHNPTLINPAGTYNHGCCQCNGDCHMCGCRYCSANGIMRFECELYQNCTSYGSLAQSPPGWCLTAPPSNALHCTAAPTNNPTKSPTKNPTKNPTMNPTNNPTGNPTTAPTSAPADPTRAPATTVPTTSPTTDPTRGPTLLPIDCGEGTVLQGRLCVAAAQPSSFCEEGTKLENGGCVPDCANLRRRDITCSSCGDDSAAAQASEDTDSSSSMPLIILGVVALLLFGGGGFVVYKRGQGSNGATSSTARSTANPVYEGGKTDGFGFGKAADSGYLEVDGAPANH